MEAKIRAKDDLASAKLPPMPGEHSHLSGASMQPSLRSHAQAVRAEQEKARRELRDEEKRKLHEEKLKLLELPIFSYLPSKKDFFQVPANTKLIAIDFDGTTMRLGFTESTRQNAFRFAIQQVGSQLIGRNLTRSEIDRCHHPAQHKTEDEMSRIIAGRLTEITGTVVTPNRMWNAWLQGVQELLSLYDRSPETAITRGLKRMLRDASQRGINTITVSNGAFEFVEQLTNLKALEPLRNHTQNLFVNLVPGIRAKPHPDPYLLAAHRAKVSPGEMLALEDTSTGALAALRAGVPVLLQPSGSVLKTLREIVSTVEAEHPGWLQSRLGAITLMKPGQGWRQVRFP